MAWYIMDKSTQQIDARQIASLDLLALCPMYPRTKQYCAHVISIGMEWNKIKTTPTKAGAVAEVQV